MFTMYVNKGNNQLHRLDAGEKWRYIKRQSMDKTDSKLFVSDPCYTSQGGGGDHSFLSTAGVCVHTTDLILRKCCGLSTLSSSVWFH